MTELLPILTTSIIPHHQEEQPPSGMCTYQEKINNGLWKCYSESEYAQKNANEILAREQCIVSRPMPNYPVTTDILGCLLMASILISLFYCIETQKWGRGLLAMVIFGYILYFLKPFC